jgi:hypothetical protein
MGSFKRIVLLAMVCLTTGCSVPDCFPLEDPNVPVAPDVIDFDGATDGNADAGADSDTNTDNGTDGCPNNDTGDPQGPCSELTKCGCRYECETASNPDAGCFEISACGCGSFCTTKEIACDIESSCASEPCGLGAVAIDGWDWGATIYFVDGCGCY